MEVKVLSSKIVKPAYNAGATPATEYIPLSIFDRVTFQMQMAIIYAFASPAPSTAAIEKGLAAVLAQYRAFAGQLGINPDDGAPSFILNDRGARLVEASVDANLIDMAPAKPTPELLKLHPDLEGELEEVVLLQLTRFRCGSLAVGFTSNHVVADGHATSNFLVAWGRATRGLAMGAPPCTTTRTSSSPARHLAWSTTTATGSTTCRLPPMSSATMATSPTTSSSTRRTSPRTSLPGSVAARRRGAAGRSAGDLLNRPLKHAAQVIHDEVARVDGGYFQSFVDFATSGAAEKEGLAPSAVCKDVMCPDVEVDTLADVPVLRAGLRNREPQLLHAVLLPYGGNALPHAVLHWRWQRRRIAPRLPAQPPSVQRMLLLHGVGGHGVLA
ncbi:hypothetical protein ACQ4PT_013374 [Festuca glaucescens]